jgi:tartrate dehydrogenase/decarboxylase/D-malate dehydrogenase
MTHAFKIALIPGDGIGKEVLPEGVRVLDAAAQRFGLALHYTPIDWASCDWYQQHGQMMPDDWKAQLQGQDALFFGAVGWPATVPDHVSLWGSLLKIPARIRPVHQPAPGAPVRRCAVPAGGAQGR